MIKEFLMLGAIAFIFGIILGWHSVQQHLDVSVELLLFAALLIGSGYWYTRRKAIARLIEADD